MTWAFDPLVPMSYEVIVADPPWRFRTWSETNQAKAASRHYDLMMLDDIKALPVGQLAQGDCLLLLWCCAPMLPQALDVMKAWGFTYKSNTNWRKVTPAGKVRMGTGYWARTMHEQILIGSIGKPRKFSAFPSVFDGLAREHSRKPDEFYKLVEKHTAGLRRADVFARQSRPGWDCWGNESTKFDEAAE
jgi:N6-adenosine-specific RNA methylase IME4